MGKGTKKEDHITFCGPECTTDIFGVCVPFLWVAMKDETEH